MLGRFTNRPRNYFIILEVNNEKIIDSVLEVYQKLIEEDEE